MVYSRHELHWCRKELKELPAKVGKKHPWVIRIRLRSPLGIWNRYNYWGESSWNGDFAGLNAFIILINIKIARCCYPAGCGSSGAHNVHRTLWVAWCIHRAAIVIMINFRANVYSPNPADDVLNLCSGVRFTEVGPNQCAHTRFMFRRDFLLFLFTIHSRFPSLFLFLFVYSANRGRTSGGRKSNIVAVPAGASVQR